MKQGFLLFTFVLMACPAWAISNIENERPNLPEQGISGGIKFGLQGKTGNQEEQSYEAGMKLFYRAGDEILMALFEKDYGSKHYVKDTDTTFLHGRWTHLLNDKWAVEGFAQWEENEFDNLTSRTLAGGGGRYTIARERNVYSLAVGLGGFREYEKLDLQTYEEINRLWRVNTYYSYQYQLNEQLALVNTTYYQPAMRDSDDYRILSDIGFTIKLSEKFNFKINYRFTYDSKPAKNLEAVPPIDNDETNTEYKTALSYSF